MSLHVPDGPGAEGDAGALRVEVVANDSLRLAFLPSLGGRLISLECEGTELLWRNPEYLDTELRTVKPRHTWRPLDGSMGSWANVGGSKTWPAPQGWGGPSEWAGPPDPVLDSGEWTFSSAERPDGSTRVTMISGDDPRSGLRVTREFMVPARGRYFRQRNTFTNTSKAPVLWSIWEVCQVDTAPFFAESTVPDGPGIEVGVTGAAEPISMVEAAGRVTVAEPENGVRRVEVDEVVAKVAFTDATGLIRFTRPDGVVVTWHFAVPPGDYPDGGAQVELWMQYPTADPLYSLGGLHPTAHLVELEALSPLHRIASGGSATHVIDWSIDASG